MPTNTTSSGADLPSAMSAWQFASTQGGIEQHMVLNPSVALPRWVPKPGRPATLVRVLAAAINPVDYKIPELPLVGRIVSPPPSVPAKDFVGRVVHTTAPGLTPGDLVVGSGFAAAALSDFILVKDKGVALAKVPPGLLGEGRQEPHPRLLAEVAGLGVAGLTAMMALRDLPKGGNVFIHGSSGGVGTYAVQIAKRVMGARRVVVSCSAGEGQVRPVSRHSGGGPEALLLGP